MRSAHAPWRDTQPTRREKRAAGDGRRGNVRRCIRGRPFKPESVARLRDMLAASGPVTPDRFHAMAIEAGIPRPRGGYLATYLEDALPDLWPDLCEDDDDRLGFTWHEWPPRVDRQAVLC